MLLCLIQKRTVNLHPGIVDHNIDASKVFDRLSNEICHLLILRNVGLNDHGLTLILLDSMQNLLSFILRVCIIYYNCCTCIGKMNGNGAADTAIGTGNDGNLLLELSHDKYPF